LARPWFAAIDACDGRALDAMAREEFRRRPCGNLAAPDSSRSTQVIAAPTTAVGNAQSRKIAVAVAKRAGLPRPDPTANDFSKIRRPKPQPEERARRYGTARHPETEVD